MTTCLSGLVLTQNHTFIHYADIMTDEKKQPETKSVFGHFGKNLNTDTSKPFGLFSFPTILSCDFGATPIDSLP